MINENVGPDSKSELFYQISTLKLKSMKKKKQEEATKINESILSYDTMTINEVKAELREQNGLNLRVEKKSKKGRY